MAYPMIKDYFAKHKAKKAKLKQRNSDSKKLAKISGVIPISEKLGNIPELEEKLWNLSSIFIRTRDKKINGGRCLFCGVNPIQCAAHVISRRKKATKYREDNLFGFCHTCNRRDAREPGFHDRVIKWYIQREGLETYNNLVSKSTETAKFSRDQLQTAIEHYKALLSQEKPANVNHINCPIQPKEDSTKF